MFLEIKLNRTLTDWFLNLINGKSEVHFKVFEFGMLFRQEYVVEDLKD